MARILHDGEWYEQLSTEALYEEEYERLLLAQAGKLFPGYELIPFKLLVSSEHGSARPDFALVHRQYKDWWVVEAELAHHSFEGHVRRQVDILSRAYYSEQVAKHLNDKAPELEYERLCSMVKGEQPRVLVVVNQAMPQWARELARYNALVAVLEVFRSRNNKHLYRLNGEKPTDSGLLTSKCQVEVGLSRFLRVLSPGILPISHGERMQIFFRSGVTDWSRLDTADRVYLVTHNPIALDARRRYDLVSKSDGGFVLREL